MSRAVSGAQLTATSELERARGGPQASAGEAYEAEHILRGGEAAERHHRRRAGPDQPLPARSVFISYSSHAIVILQ